MTPIVIIPLPRNDDKKFSKLDMEEAAKLSINLNSVLQPGYISAVEHDALGEPSPVAIVIFQQY